MSVLTVIGNYRAARKGPGAILFRSLSGSVEADET